MGTTWKAIRRTCIGKHYRAERSVAAATEAIEALRQRKNRRRNCQRISLPRRSHRSAASIDHGKVGDQIASAVRGGCLPVSLLAHAETEADPHNKSVSCSHRVTHWPLRSLHLPGRSALGENKLEQFGYNVKLQTKLHCNIKLTR
jgi:hypothetical protein